MSNAKKRLRKMLPQCLSNVLEDPRKGKVKWMFSKFLSAVVDGLVSGCSNLRSLEDLTDWRGERIPDTTLHDVLVKTDPAPLKEYIAREVKQAKRKHHLDAKEDLPINLTAIDGKKVLVTRYRVNECSQRRGNQHQEHYVHTVLRASHVSTKLKPIMGQYALSGETNEMGGFANFFNELNGFYGKTTLLDVISLDFGFMSADNAATIVNAGKDYIIALKDPKTRRDTTALAQQLLGNRDTPDEIEEDTGRKGTHIERRLYRCSTPPIKGWEHAKQFWRIEKITTHIETGKVTTEDFYRITSLACETLSHRQVLLATRLHWNIENNANWVMDTVWQEDKCPIIAAAFELIGLLRIIAYNAIATIRCRQLAIGDRITGWKPVIQLVRAILFPLSQETDPLNLTKEFPVPTA